MSSDRAGQVRSEPARSGYRVVLIGEIDLTLKDEWDAAVKALAEAEPPTVTVDLSATTFIDSSGLGALVRIHRETRRWGATATLAGAEGAAARALELSGIDRLFT